MINKEPLPIIYVNSGSQVPIICPKCNFSKLVQVHNISSRSRVLNLVCKCKHSFKIQIEFRKYARKVTCLKGLFTSHQNSSESLPVEIVNLSRGGACFELISAYNLEIGTKGTLVFQLDDKPRSIINKEVTIVFVESKRIGCEFIHDKDYEKALGFYVTF